MPILATRPKDPNQPIIWLISSLSTIFIHIMALLIMEHLFHKASPKSLPIIVELEELSPIVDKKSISSPKKPVILNELIQEEKAKLSMTLLKSAQQSSNLDKKTDSKSKEFLKNVEEKQKKGANNNTDSQSHPLNRNNTKPLPLLSSENTQSSLMDSLSNGLNQEIPLKKKELSEKKRNPINFSPIPKNYFLVKTKNNYNNSDSEYQQELEITNHKKYDKHIEDNSSTKKINPETRSATNTFFTLSDYNWSYESYMGRWAKILGYHWRNSPPPDYVSGEAPHGGNVYVKVSINKDGDLLSYEITHVNGATPSMETSVIDAILSSTSLPELPKDFSGEYLDVHFNFFYPPLYKTR